MIKFKQSYCAKCGNYRPIYSKSLCHTCYWIPKKTPLPRSTNPIQKFSKKRQKENRTYKKLRDEYLKDHPNCERCGAVATDLHHKKGRIGDYLTDSRFFSALCRQCHNYIETHPNEAKSLGLSFSRLTKDT